MAAGWDRLQTTGTRGSLPHLLTLWAEVYLHNGEIENSETMLEQALALTEQNSENFYLVETYRVQGMLLRRKAMNEEAEAYFERAISLAQAQDAKLWELRAVTELVQVWTTAQGSGGDAYARLSKIYNQFTEGFDTPDLQKARLLLEDLSSQGG